jgi:hypothetical protein
MGLQMKNRKGFPAHAPMSVITGTSYSHTGAGAQKLFPGTAGGG